MPDERLITAMHEYESRFGYLFPRMCLQDASDDEVIELIEKCLKDDKPYDVKVEPGIIY